MLDDLLDKTIILSYTNIGYHLRQWRWSDREREMAGKICLVTGANAGLGKVVATALAERWAEVHMICRSRERGEAAQQAIIAASGNDNVHLHLVDMSRQQDIQDFVGGFAPDHVDVLVNNAGVLLPERRENEAGIEMTFATNVLGYFLLTELLFEKLAAADGARVINVTSGGMYAAYVHVDDLQWKKRPYDGTNAYAESKRAEVIMTQQWAEAWASTDILVHSVHPGWAATPGVASSLPRFNAVMGPLLRTPDQGADGIVWLATTPNLAQYENGQLWFDRRPRSPHKMGVRRNTPAEIEQFWHTLHDMTGLDEQ